MALTPETLVRHELAGLCVRVVDATNPSLVGIQGRVRRETTNTLVVAGESDGERRVWQVPKAEATFEVAFVPTDETAGDPETGSVHAPVCDAREGPGTAFEPVGEPTGEDVAYVTVDGGRLLSRPARRTETTGDSPWESD